MSDLYPWYRLVEGPDLTQGDRLNACPVIRPLESGQFEKLLANVVVLSQSCDLANDKLEIVLVCPVFSLTDLAASVEILRTRKGREELRRGHLIGYHLLNRCEILGHESDFLVCDFRSLLGVHVSVAKSQASKYGKRLGLQPPYREHLAQAFARFVMRVGLPTDVPPFK